MNRTREWTRRRRGTAILEFVLALPLLATVIVTTFFFGWAMRSQQAVKISDRYTAWQWAQQRPVSEESLDAKFFDHRTSWVEITGHDGPDATREDLVAEAAVLSQPAGELAARTVFDRWPRGYWVRVQAEFTPRMDAWRHFNGPIRSHHVREGVEWRRDQARNESAIRDQFLDEMDVLLDSCPAPGDGLAETFRRLYLTRW